MSGRKPVEQADRGHAVPAFRNTHKCWLVTEVVLLAVAFLASGLAVDVADYFSSDWYWQRRNLYGQFLGNVNMGQCNAHIRKLQQECDRRTEEWREVVVRGLVSRFGESVDVRQDPPVLQWPYAGLYVQHIGHTTLDVNDYAKIAEYVFPRHVVEREGPILMSERTASQKVIEELRGYWRYRTRGKR
jgi:hypothetical protein